MDRKVIRGALVGFSLVGALYSTACNPLGGDDAAAPAIPEITSSSSPSSSAKPAAAKGVPADVQVQDNDGMLKFVPPSDGEDITDGDTRDNESMPALQQLLPKCGVLINWEDVVKCVNKQKAPHDAKWYIDGFNQRTDITLGATWEDVVKMSKAKVPKDTEVRVIQVYGWTEKEKSKAQAQRDVAPLVGEEAASKMHVIYYNVDAFANTWKTKGDKPAMETFADYHREVRVTLAPLVLNPDGSFKGLLEGVPWGIFVDCYNLHGFWKVVPKTPKSPLLCPPGTPNAGQPMTGGCYPGQPPCTTGNKCTTPPPECKVTPCKPPEECKPPNNCSPGKNTNLDPQAQGSNKTGHGGTNGPQPDPISPPAGGQPPATDTPPAPSTQPTTPRPVPTTTPVVVDPEPSHTTAPPPPPDW